MIGLCLNPSPWTNAPVWNAQIGLSQKIGAAFWRAGYSVTDVVVNGALHKRALNELCQRTNDNGMGLIFTLEDPKRPDGTPTISEQQSIDGKTMIADHVLSLKPDTEFLLDNERWELSRGTESDLRRYYDYSQRLRQNIQNVIADSTAHGWFEGTTLDEEMSRYTARTIKIARAGLVTTYHGYLDGRWDIYEGARRKGQICGSDTATEAGILGQPDDFLYGWQMRRIVNAHSRLGIRTAIYSSHDNAKGFGWLKDDLTVKDLRVAGFNS